MFDFAGNLFTSSVNYTLTIDTTLPIVNITYPFNTTYNSIITSMNYTLIELNINNCWYYNGTANNSVTCRNNLTTNLLSTQGSNTWLVYANDSAGNTNYSSITFFVDSINPQINFTSPTLSSDSYRNQNYILINVSSNDTNIMNSTIYLYNSTNSLINSSFNSSV